MKPGSKVTYRGTTYYFIGELGGITELAPTPHGAGSFLIATDLIRNPHTATILNFNPSPDRTGSSIKNGSTTA